ncbi:GIY-YIG nuclease family protein [Kiloniella majae]|uniref:GIY-YIG nuclease family protein n=1 Tax=Kiloniella majae TaxID=1938558 RepID=UPI000A278E08|nr:GIY-YIG nuclease family protein [Kiloniella majae]
MSHVYFISPVNGGPIRIGRTKALDNRLNSLMNMSPIELELIGSIDGGEYVEYWLHEFFAKDRLHSEWFKPSKKLLEFAEDARSGVRNSLIPKEPENKFYVDLNKKKLAELGTDKDELRSYLGLSKASCISTLGYRSVAQLCFRHPERFQPNDFYDTPKNPGSPAA